MPSRMQTIDSADDELRGALRALRDELDLRAVFDRETLGAAERAARSPRPPTEDAREIPFVTIDPEGSQDLDQAVHFARSGRGFTVHYAIADVAAFVAPGDAVDDEARQRGQTLYAADGRIPLHPEVISEGAASLLPDVDRLALVWRFELDADGHVRETALRRQLIRSREQLSYVEAQRRIDDGTADASLALLPVVGELRIALELERGGASLDMPEEQIVCEGGVYSIARRQLLGAEQWNAQISLMTGMEAAAIMLEAGAGILRTMPAPDAAALAQFRREAAALGLDWPAGVAYGEFLRTVDRAAPEGMALLQAARRLFRGAGYTVLTGAESAESVIQAAIGAPYAHATAPLRRLVDRYVLAHCLAIANGEEVPEWARSGLDGLAEVMRSSAQRAGALERASVDLVEISVLADRVGERFDAIVIEQRETDSRIQLVDPPTEASCVTDAAAGESITAELQEADLASRTLRFAESASS